MAYMRIASGKFWAWVVVSLLVGLAIGLTIMLVRTGSLSDKITVLEHQLSSASGATTETIGAIQAQLTSAEASVTALTQQNEQLSADLTAATSGSGSGSTTTTEAAPTLVVVSRTVTPSTVATSGTITMTVKVKGAPSKVVMRVYNASKSFDKTYTLKKVSTSGTTQTWRLKVAAPKTKGTYHYFATAKKGSVSVTMKGVSASIFKVK